jgi:hypothetical protein
MPQKRGEVDEKADVSVLMPDTYESWLRKRVKARSVSLADQTEEEEIDRTEDAHEKAHRRKRGKGATAGGSK